MASFEADMVTSDFETLYRHELEKRGLKWEDAPLVKGEVRVNVPSGIKTKVSAAAYAAKETAVKVGKKIGESGEAALEFLPDTLKMLPVILGVLALGVAGYFIFAGRKGVKLMPF